MREKQTERNLFKGIPPKFRYDLSGFLNGLKLLNCELRSIGESRFSINNELEPPNKGYVFNSIDRAGSRLPYQCELYPSQASQRSSKIEEFGISYPFDIDSKGKKVESFDIWFQNWLDGRILVPDTCIIEEHYLSHVY